MLLWSIGSLSLVNRPLQTRPRSMQVVSCGSQALGATAEALTSWSAEAARRRSMGYSCMGSKFSISMHGQLKPNLITKRFAPKRRGGALVGMVPNYLYSKQYSDTCSRLLQGRRAGGHGVRLHGAQLLHLHGLRDG